MKQAIKSILPGPVLNKARKIKDRLGLVTLPQQSFTPDNLRSSATLPLASFLADKEIAASWKEDRAIITDIYKDDDRYGGVNPGDRQALYYLIMALKPGNALEVGTHIGASTLHIARALKRLNKGGTVTSVDIIDVNHAQNAPWKHLGLAKSPKDIANELECLKHIGFHVGPCLDFMGATEQRYDFIFLDGDHTAQAVYKEISAALSRLNTGGTILLHDYYPEGKALFPDRNIISGPYEALERIKKETTSINVLPLGKLPWETKQGTKNTSLALVVKD